MSSSAASTELKFLSVFIYLPLMADVHAAQFKGIETADRRPWAAQTGKHRSSHAQQLPDAHRRSPRAGTHSCTLQRGARSAPVRPRRERDAADAKPEQKSSLLASHPSRASISWKFPNEWRGNAVGKVSAAAPGSSAATLRPAAHDSSSRLA